jgi:hypothetical protein
MKAKTPFDAVLGLHNVFGFRAREAIVIDSIKLAHS